MPSDVEIRKAEADQTSIGNILVRLKLCKPADVEVAIEVQRTRIPLGEILVSQGRITRGELESALLEQRIARGKANRREESRFRKRVATDIASLSRSSCDTIERGIAALEAKR